MPSATVTTRTRLKRTTTPKTKTNYGEYRFCNLVPRIRNIDCAYCINRRSNDLPRATLSVAELVDLTMEFYRRNYIAGLFLSSGVVRNPDYTMERLVRVDKDLRTIHRFNGYIHLKSIPGASRDLVNEAGL